MDKHEEFQKRIMATFRLEAEENIRAMTSYLIEMEKEPTETRKEELFEVLYRSAHSLKGASRAVDYSEIESLCHAFEDVMSAVRNQEIKFNSQVLDMLFQTVDLVEKALNVMEEGPDSGLSATIANHLDNLTMVEAGLEVETPVAQKSLKAEQVADIAPETQPVTENNSEKSRQKIQKNKQKLVQKNTTLATNSAKKSQSEKAANDIFRKRSGETIRISTDRLDNLLNKVEEMLSLKLNAAQQTENIQHTLNKFFAWHKEAIEISAATRNLKQAISTNNNSLNGQGRELSKLINFFESSLVQFNDFQKKLNEHLNFSKQESRSADLKIETLLNEVKDLLSVPFSTLLDGFPKMLRDISKNLGKEVNFVVEGDNIEIDRRILEQLRNPLTHLLRNSIDYGVEFPDVRKKKNKPLKGRISVKIEQVENSKVEVTISDDGHGIDIEKLKTVYAEKEKKSEKEIEKVSKEELLNYMFKSGVSTSNI
ncbi:MAG: Hpt domain-containing protein, partial [Prolixibacteraceae bacterium]|nr:Hpt domain-containing protein [Prolixibacteraceae bacterium]